MSIDLSKIKQRDVINCEFAKAKEIVEALEQIKPFKYKSIDAVEELEGYLSNALIIKGRILNGDFKSDCKEKEKKDLIQKLDYIIDHFNSALEINITLINQSAQVIEWIADAKSRLDKQKRDIDEKAQEVQEQIDDSEHTILSHVLTLMGIFTAIITLIISVVITSSSWLNSAHGASAVIAFIVPNLVALIAVFVLTSLIFFYIHRDTQSKDGKCSKHKRSLAFTICIVSLIICVIASCLFCFAGRDEIINPHILYILSPGEYQVQEEIVTPADSDAGVDEQKEYFYEFIFEDKLYRFEYNESLLHDGNLYFCTEHNTLE